jgi:hypothetical protein
VHLWHATPVTPQFHCSQPTVLLLGILAVSHSLAVNPRLFVPGDVDHIKHMAVRRFQSNSQVGDAQSGTPSSSSFVKPQGYGISNSRSLPTMAPPFFPYSAWGNDSPTYETRIPGLAPFGLFQIYYSPFRAYARQHKPKSYQSKGSFSAGLTTHTTIVVPH